MRGGAREGAGRKPGGQNAKSAAIAQKAAAAGITPLEYMLDLMREELPEEADATVKIAHKALRFEAAKAAAPYVHPRLTALQHQGHDGGPLKIIHEVA